MPARMTPRSWLRGVTNALICLLILLVGPSLIARLISSISHRSLADSYRLAWPFFWGLFLLLFLSTWLYGLNARGRILLDCGPNQERVPPLILGALGLVSGALSMAMGFSGGFGGVRCRIRCSGSQSGPLSSFRPQAGFRFGRGIWQYFWLLRWEKIGSCRLSEDSTLTIVKKTRLPFLGRGALPVPPEQQQALVELLQKHCSAVQ